MRLSATFIVKELRRAQTRSAYLHLHVYRKTVEAGEGVVDELLVVPLVLAVFNHLSNLPNDSQKKKIEKVIFAFIAVVVVA